MSNSTLQKSMNKGTEKELDKARAEEILKPIQGKNGETLNVEQAEAIREEGSKKAEGKKGMSVDKQDIIGAEEYKKAEEKLREGDLIGTLKLQAFAALGAYGPAKRNAAITKFGSGILASTCTGWAGFLLKVANSSGLTDRVIQEVVTNSAAADAATDAKEAQKTNVAAPKPPTNTQRTLAQHSSEHAAGQQPQIDSLNQVAMEQKGGRSA